MAINILYPITCACIRIAKIGMLLASSVCFLLAPASADQLDSVFEVGQSKAAAAQNSQIKIDGIADQTDALLQNYKQVNKEIEGLRVYNAQLEARIQNQLDRIAEIDEAMSQVTVIQRQITPLMIKMLDGLENFIELYKILQGKMKLPLNTGIVVERE